MSCYPHAPHLQDLLDALHAWRDSDPRDESADSALVLALAQFDYAQAGLEALPYSPRIEDVAKLDLDALVAETVRLAELRQEAEVGEAMCKVELRSRLEAGEPVEAGGKSVQIIASRRFNSGRAVQLVASLPEELRREVSYQTLVVDKDALFRLAPATHAAACDDVTPRVVIK